MWLVSAALLAATLPAASQAPQPPPSPPPQQPPIFRGGTNLVQVDAIVADPNGQPIVDLAAADFELLDDGKPMAIDCVRFLGAAEYSGDATLAPIRSHEDVPQDHAVRQPPPRDGLRAHRLLGLQAGGAGDPS
jgi:hypothetical protein